MVSIDLKDAYPQVPIHPSSRKFLRFTAAGRAWQFKILCFCLSMAPQVFTRVMTPVSAFLHQSGVRMLRYLDNWLILASSREEVCWARDKVLRLCQDLGIVVNLDKSSFVLSQTMVCLGIKIESQTFRASPTPLRIEKFSIAEEFPSSKVQFTKFWRVLLGQLAMLTHLILGGLLRMRVLQLALKRSRNFQEDSFLVPWDNLLWWCAEACLEKGGSLSIRTSDIMLWSDASDQGWGTTVAYQFASGRWLEGELLLSVNHQELLVVQRGLHVFQDLLFRKVVVVFSDNTTAVSYFRRQGDVLTGPQRSLNRFFVGRS